MYSSLFSIKPHHLWRYYDHCRIYDLEKTVNVSLAQSNPFSPRVVSAMDPSFPVLLAHPYHVHLRARNHAHLITE